MILDAPLEDILAACGRDDTAVIGERRLRGGVSTSKHPAPAIEERRLQRCARGGCLEAHAEVARIGRQDRRAHANTHHLKEVHVCMGRVASEIG